jgi:hypothetical protein
MNDLTRDEVWELIHWADASTWSLADYRRARVLLRRVLRQMYNLMGDDVTLVVVDWDYKNDG